MSTPWPSGEMVRGGANVTAVPPRWFRRTITATTVLAAATVGGYCLLQAGPLFKTAESLSTIFLGMGTGSPRDARHWREALADVASPEEAQARYPQVVTKRFANGEWVVVVSRDSHSSPRGGTVVVRDCSASASYPL